MPLYPEDIPLPSLTGYLPKKAQSAVNYLSGLLNAGSPTMPVNGGPVSGGTGLALSDMVPDSKAGTALALASMLPVGKIAKGEKLVKLFRGENAGNKGGNYFSTDKEFAREFTQSGRDAEIKAVNVPTSHIYKPESLPFAGDEAAIEDAISKAKAGGHRAIWVDEGQGQPNSVFVFDKSILKK